MYKQIDQVAIQKVPACLMGVLCLALLTLLAGGCSNEAAEKPENRKTSVPISTNTEAAAEETVSTTLPETEERPAIASVATEVTPAAEIDFDGPTLNEQYPGLASESLVHAVLADLPEGILLQSQDLIITQNEIDAQIAKAPLEVRKQLRNNAFFLLEQSATKTLLVKEARQSLGNVSGDERSLIQKYLQNMVQGATVSEQEISEFYENNREMVGNAPLEQVEGQIQQYLLQDKQQQMVQQHIRGIAQRIPVAVSAKWIPKQAELIRKNPVDQARASGMPTLASFGADTCIPCQMMAPTRDALRKKYAGEVNVVYVHVGKEQILASRFGVQGIPLLIFFDAEGQEYHRRTGVMSQEEIEDLLKKMGVQG